MGDKSPNAVASMIQSCRRSTRPAFAGSGPSGAGEYIGTENLIIQKRWCSRKASYSGSLFIGRKEH
jgi:hypothetical protein